MKNIAIIITFGALLVGCSENRNKAVSAKPSHKAQTQTLTSSPIVSAKHSVAAVPARTHAKKQALRQAAVRNDKVSSGHAAPVVAVQKKPLRAMTFNEAQFSDKASTFPRTSEALKLEEEKYID